MLDPAAALSLAAPASETPFLSPSSLMYSLARSAARGFIGSLNVIVSFHVFSSRDADTNDGFVASVT